MQLNIEDKTIASLVVGLGKEIGELVTANIFMSNMIENLQADNNSMHNLLASRDETIKNMNEKLSEMTGINLELKKSIDTKYRGPRNGDKDKRRAPNSTGDDIAVLD